MHEASFIFYTEDLSLSANGTCKSSLIYRLRKCVQCIKDQILIIGQVIGKKHAEFVAKLVTTRVEMCFGRCVKRKQHLDMYIRCSATFLQQPPPYPGPALFFRSGRRSMHSLLFWPLENNHLSITEATPKANPKSQILPLENVNYSTTDERSVQDPIFYQKKWRNFTRSARLCSLLWFGFYIIGIFSIVLRQIYRLQDEGLQMKMLYSPKKGIILHPYLPITATPLQRRP